MRYFLFLLIIACSFSIKAQQTFPFKIHIKEHPNSKVILSEIYGEKFSNIDTLVTDDNGNASYLFTDESSVGMYRLFLDRNAFADFIFNNEAIELSTEFDHPMDSLTVIKSVENKLYYDFLRADQQFQLKLELLNPLTTYYPKNDELYETLVNKFTKVQEQRDVWITDVMEQHPNSFVSKVMSFMRSPFIPSDLSEQEKMKYMQVHYFDKIDFGSADILRTDVLPTKLITYLSLFSNRNYNQQQMEDAFKHAIDLLMSKNFENQLVREFVIEYLVGGFEKYGFESVIVHIADNYEDETACENEERKSDLQTRLENFKKLAVGKTAPDIIIPNEFGENIQLSSLNNDYVMLVFWATWCPHCTQWMPQIKELYDAQKKKNVEVLAISIDKEEDAANWKKYVKENKLTWLNGSELKGWNSKVALDYNIYATPTIIVLDKNRKIVSKPLSMQQIKQEFLRK